MRSRVEFAAPESVEDVGIWHVVPRLPWPLARLAPRVVSTRAWRMQHYVSMSRRELTALTVTVDYCHYGSS